MDTSDYTDLLDITDILNADPHTLLSFTDENTTLKSYTEDQQPSHNPNFNHTLTEPEAFQNYDSFYNSPQSASSIEQNRLNNGVNQDMNMNMNMNINANPNKNGNVLDEIAESKELDEIAQYLIENQQHNKYEIESINLDNSPGNANIPLKTNWYKNIYTHMNNHISFTTDDIPFQGSTKSTPTSPDASNIIDEQLMTEIDSLINKNALIDYINSPNNPNTDQFLEQQTHSFAPPTLSLPDRVNKLGIAKAASNSQNHHYQLVKKPSVKRLPSNVSQSPATKRLAKSPSKTELFTGMAQTAAVLATNSSSSKSLASFQRHESARAAARAVGNTFENLSSKPVVRSSQTKLRKKSSCSGNLGGSGRTRLSNARSHPNLKAQASTKVRDDPRNAPTRSLTQYTKSPSMNSIFDIDNMTLDSSSSSFLDSPLRVSRLKSAKIKPSSCSIYSSATSASLRTNVSNVSNGSCTSKSSRGSGTFDQYSQLPGSSETLETIVSMDTNASNDKDNQHRVNFSVNDRANYNHYTSSNSLKNSSSYPNLRCQSSSSQPKQPPSFPVHPPHGVISYSQGNARTGSTLSTKTDSSTTSPTCALYTSTPSPVAGSSNIMFTPPNLITPNIGNNYLNRAQSTTSSTEMEFANSSGSPLTPVTKTAIKFEQLSTNSPQFCGAPKLSVWKTSPEGRREREKERERGKSVSLNAVAQSSQKQHMPERKQYMNTAKFTNNFIEEPISYRSNKPQNHSQSCGGDCQVSAKNSNSTYSFSVVPSTANTHATAHHKPVLTVSTGHPAFPRSTAGGAAASVYPSRIKNLTASSHASRNSVHSVHSSTSTNSTISNPSTQDDRDGRPEESKRSSVDSKSARGEKSGGGGSKHSKSSKDAAFKNLITTFNKKEPECYKPKVYSNMMQGLVEFQVKMGKSAKSTTSTTNSTRR